MKFVQVQFSLKYEPQLKIRRNANQIEDLLQKYYGAPQVISIPDEIAAEMPRIILTSLKGDSQISFSQISVDFTTKFENEDVWKYEDIKIYIQERIQLLKQVLNAIGIDGYYFFGLTYNINLDIEGYKPLEYIKLLLGGNLTEKDNLYEVMQRVATLEEDKFFINQQISTFKQYQSNGTKIPDLLDFSNSKLINEGVSVSLDVNNRYSFLQKGNATKMQEFDRDFVKIFDLIEYNLKKLKIKDRGHIL